MDFLGGLPFKEGYGCLAPKGVIPHPWAQKTLPEIFVEICWLLLFISFYGKFEIFPEKTSYYFFTGKLTTFLKTKGSPLP